MLLINTVYPITKNNTVQNMHYTRPTYIKTNYFQPHNYGDICTFGSVNPNEIRLLLGKIACVFDLNECNTQIPGLVSNIKTNSKGKIVSFDKLFPDQRRITVSAHIQKHMEKESPYMVLKESGTNANGNFICVDMISLKPVHLDNVTLTPVNINGRFCKIEENDKNYAANQKLLERYVKQIFEIEDTTKKQRAKTKRTAVKPQNPDRKRIQTKSIGEIDPLTQGRVFTINSTLENIRCFQDKNRGNFAKIARFKNNYQGTVQTPKGSKGITFKYGGGERLTVLHTLTGKNSTRIIYTNNEGESTHYLIENGKYLVANLNEKKPATLPTKFRYYTQEQIDNTPIKRYVHFLRNALNEYFEQMQIALAPVKSSKKGINTNKIQ